MNLKITAEGIDVSRPVRYTKKTLKKQIYGKDTTRNYFLVGAFLFSEINTNFWLENIDSIQRIIFDENTAITTFTLHRIRQNDWTNVLFDSINQQMVLNPSGVKSWYINYFYNMLAFGEMILKSDESKLIFAIIDFFCLDYIILSL